MRTRVLAAFLAVVFVILVAQDLPLIGYLQSEERARVMVSLERDAWQLASTSEPPMYAHDYVTLQDIAEHYNADTRSRVEIVDAAGTVMASTKPGEIGFDYSNRPEIASALMGLPITGERDSELLGGRMLYVAVPIHEGGAVSGALRLTYPVASVNSIVLSRLRVVFVSGLLTLLIAIGAAIWLADVVSRRLRQLHAATEQLASGNLSARVAAIDGGAPELRALETAFNTMASRLQTLVESQQAFASDASHQLRTPLTALRLRLENTAAVLDDPHATAESIDDAVNEVQRLQLLVDGLLALARLEGAATARASIDVDAVIAERVELWTPLAIERDVTLETSVTHGLRVEAVPNALEQILDSYLDNALEVAPTGSTVTLLTVVHESSVEFHVVDEGRGLVEPERHRAFDRFWRGHADGNGTGLGLAIAARLAQVSGGTVRLDANVPSGIDAVVVLERSGH
jgi:signal transduction histidine kinase